MDKNTLKRSNQESKQFTRDCIRTALIYLMNDLPFEKITVTAIINRAGVSRAGFYRNYTSKEEVLDELAEITSQQLNAFITDQKYESNPYQWYLDLFNVIKDNQEEFRLLIKAQLPHNYSANFVDPIKKLFATQPTKDYYRSMAVAASLKEILVDWFERGMPESPEDMASLFIELFHH